VKKSIESSALLDNGTFDTTPRPPKSRVPRSALAGELLGSRMHLALKSGVFFCPAAIEANLA